MCSSDLDRAEGSLRRPEIPLKAGRSGAEGAGMPTTQRSATGQRATGAGNESRLLIGLTAGVLLVAVGLLGGGVMRLIESAHGLFRALP